MDISKKKQGRDDPALALSQLNIDYFLNLLLNPTRPIGPGARKNMLLGMGLESRSR
jgi:hypothetical protein